MIRGFEADRWRGVVYLRGELDVAAEGEAREALRARGMAGETHTVDVSGLTFVDSTGVKLLADAVMSVRAGGPLRVVGASRMIRRLFDISGLTDHPSFMFQDLPEESRRDLARR